MRILITMALALCFTASASMSDVTQLMTGWMITGTSAVFQPSGPKRTFQASGLVASSTGSAVVNIQGSDDGTNWKTIGTITLTLGTSATNDGFVSDAPWRYVQANIGTLSGTGAIVTVTMGAN